MKRSETPATYRLDEEMAETRQRAFDTRAIHAGESPDPVTGAHGVPLYQNSTYAFRSFEQVEGYKAGILPHFDYTRGGNPTLRCFELKMADLEGAAQATTAATGMAAITATLAEVLGTGGHLVVASDLYHYTSEFCAIDVPATGGTVTRVEIGDLAEVEAAIRPETCAIYCETFSNPHLHVADIPTLAEIAHRHGALLIVDNTFLSPAILRPLEFGADLVIHSATKYLAGTGQVMGGVVTGNCDWVPRIHERLVRVGGTMSPFAAWMLLAGVKTLPLRIERHSSNATTLAALLAESDGVATVAFPGLQSHAGHDVARRMTGGRYGGLFSFTLRGGEDAARAFVNALELTTIALSLGEPSTLIWPLGNGALRVAVGLEDPTDLVADFKRGLAAVESQMVAQATH
jgi:cystathionine beta-lyase/cystathionine gamma-synthase